jgi:hypothetical protein
MAKPLSANLVIVTSDSGSELADTAGAMRLLHGHGALVRVQTSKELLDLLGRYSSIGHLVFTFHGAPGQIFLGPVNNSENVDLMTLARKIKEQQIHTHVSQMSFESCEVANGPEGASALAAFMKALGTYRASAYNVSHAWGKYKISRTSAAGTLLVEKEPRFERIKKFLIPGQPTIADIALHPHRQTLYFEFFTRMSAHGRDIYRMRETFIEYGVRSRSELRPQVWPVEKAKSVPDAISGDMLELILEDKTAEPAPRKHTVHHHKGHR